MFKIEYFITYSPIFVVTIKNTFRKITQSVVRIKKTPIIPSAVFEKRYKWLPLIDF